jgi:2-(1,2-epoxy-1,2-dihydrophenyl)acetyl-CoA isomerase
MNNHSPIRLERSSGGVATLTLGCPAMKNAMTHEFLAALHAHADALHQDSQLRCVLLESEGPMFCVGADVKQMAEHMNDLPAYVDGLIRAAHAALLRLMALSVPIVGLLRGTAAGGGASLALACDVLVAARSARLVFAYPQLGTTPDMGLSHALSERVGPLRALQLFLLSDGIAMDEAERLNLVQQVKDDEHAKAAAMQVVQRLALLPSAPAKALFLHGRYDELAARLERERESFIRCSHTEAFRERVLAFTRPRRG